MIRGLVASVFAAAVVATPLTYPVPPTGGTVDDFYGTKVADPYRTLENLDSPMTRAWVEAEAALTRSYLDAIPQRAAIRAHLERLANYSSQTAPTHAGNQYFYWANDGTLEQGLLYTMRGPHGTPRMLLDPNALSKDGSITVSGEVPSRNGSLLVYATQQSGSDWQTWHVRDVATGKDLPDVLPWSKYANASWMPDDRSFMYERYPSQNAAAMYRAAIAGHAIYVHRLGTPQSADRLFYTNPSHPKWIYSAFVTEDRRYAIVYVGSGESTNNRVGYVDLRDPRYALHELFWKEDASWAYVDNTDSRFLFTTNKNAHNTRVIAFDVRRPNAPASLVPETRNALNNATAAGRRLFLTYLIDAHTVVKVYDEEGRWLRNVELPGIGTASGFGGESTDRTVYYDYDSYTTPYSTFAYDIASGTSTLYWKQGIDFDPNQFETKEVFYRSKDGTRVPLMISYRKGIKLDGSNPTMLYGYGGFDVAVTPAFTGVTWLQMGGVYARASIRGGSEYGEAWHTAGMRANKQHVFDDFVAAAEYLIAQKYTSTPKLAIRGESNGGLLVGAVLTQRPDLFGAAVPMVGVLDMLRFDKYTAGTYWSPEYGCATCGADQFAWLYKYSPYHNVRPGTVYPPTLVMTSDHDDRVFPAHSFKFAARLQADQAGTAPILLRVQLKGGHGGGTTRSQDWDEFADIYAFLLKSLNMTLPSDFKP
ncbi:MAG: prolyl oligopeptidase family serine peptidase [Candidatus Tumulicola sp.]